MKAWIVTRYGGPDVLELRDVDTPEPGEDQIRVQVHATTVSSGDWRIRSMNVPTGFGAVSRLIFGMWAPRSPILGTEFSGRVDAVGRGVTDFSVGDAVFAYSDAMGGHAEYKVLDADSAIARIPPSLSFGEAAAMSFGGCTALEFLRRGKIEGGHRVLVNGASGAVGTAAVQLALFFGAEVTGVCSASNADLVRSLGARQVIDYRTSDVSETAETYDIIMDTAGTLPHARAKKILADDGRLLVVLGDLPAMLTAPFISMMSNRSVVAGPASGSAADLEFLSGLASDGAYRPVIDRWYPFEQMPEAHRHVDTGHKRGNVVVRVMESGPPPPTLHGGGVQA
jgi:NADPH:quinone reductase-like Zn-dependent oxidoreductase